MKAFRRRATDTDDGPATFIAPGSTITGALTGKGAYVVCGIVEGECDIDGTVTVASGGAWCGTLKATNIVVAGSVDGDVMADNRLEVAGSASISGSLSGKCITMEEGAVIEGTITMTSAGSDGQAAERSVSEAKPEIQPESRQRHQQRATA